MRRASRTPRLRRSDCSGPGLHRFRRGRGFSYTDAQGAPVTDEETLSRVRALVIPPAWRDVWICADARGHLQATGVDAAGRKQYLYHPVWRELRDRQKFTDMEQFAAALPRLRRRISNDLGGEDLTRDRVLACAVRLLDLGLFRIGSEEYAEQGGGLGLATLRREHLELTAVAATFDYPAKSGVRRRHGVSDPECLEVLRALKRRRGGPEGLLAYRDGRRWHGIRSEDINVYIKAQIGDQFSAKDFRTWNATVLAAALLSARAGSAGSGTGRKRVMNAVVKDVAAVLGNTPTVARSSYIDPRVFDRYLSNWTIEPSLSRIADLEEAGERKRRRLERAVLDLLTENDDSSALAIAS